MIRNKPTIRFSDSFHAITTTPKIRHKMARIGLETVTPIFFSPFSTTSVKLLNSPTVFYYVDSAL